MYMYVLCISLILRRPIVTGSSVLGVTFSDGVMLAADTLGTREGESITLAVYMCLTYINLYIQQ